MNENSERGAGKISVHGNGIGAPTTDMIEKRAREIALIDEREHANSGDLEQARRELGGEIDLAAPEEIPGHRESDDEHEFVPESVGHRAPETNDDDASIGERLVEGGLEEAAHDQMLEARRQLRDGKA
ncbi:MAG: hypothetical protein M3R59_04360 [Verrucomicrobiota bacterium]|nr:hypothetical protein [Verrucomicrobiota bacterium]